MSEPTALGLSARTGGVMVAFTIVFTALMAFTYGATKNQIEASATEEKMKLISEVLPPASYDNLLLDDYVELGPTPELGLAEGGDLQPRDRAEELQRRRAALRAARVAGAMKCDMRAFEHKKTRTSITPLISYIRHKMPFDTAPSSH